MSQCDADCPAWAVFVATTANGPIYFCGHHGREHEKAKPVTIKRTVSA